LTTTEASKAKLLKCGHIDRRWKLQVAKFRGLRPPLETVVRWTSNQLNHARKKLQKIPSADNSMRRPMPPMQIRAANARCV
jgi:hypothetical protein